MAEAAKNELDLDAKQPKSKKKLIFIILGAVLLIGGSIGGTLLVVGTGGGEGESAVEAPKKPAAHYMPLDSMVVNFSEKGPAKFLQVEMQLMAHDQAPLTAAEQHMPVIRNNILMALASQKFETVSTREGKEELRTAIRQSINQVLAEQAEIKEEDGIQAVYFTSFVMQ